MKHLIVLLIWTAAAAAHSGDRLYPIYELTDEMLATIDLHDGLIDEWYDIGEPSMSLLDFQTLFNAIPADPSNLDFRIWLAWHDESNRIYAAFIIIDDVYNNAHNHTEDNLNSAMLQFDSVLFNLDADHSGGVGERRGVDHTEEELIGIFGSTQRYTVIARTVIGPALDNQIRVGNSPTLSDRGLPNSWKVHPPYGDAGGTAAGENPTVSVIEMYVTPYDWWGAWDDVDQTEFSELSAHQVIGFAIMINDIDERKRGMGPFWLPVDIFAERIDDGDLLNNMADGFLDGVLLPAQETTAVESVSWGRIKASLW